MISVSEAKKKIDNAAAPLAGKTVSVNDAVGCRLIAPVKSMINVPDFVSSTMDGVAFRHNDLGGKGPWRLPIQAVIGAGDGKNDPLKPGHAIKIMTGAKLTPGCDTVVKVEDVSFDNGTVLINERVDRGNFVRPLGDDIRKGHTLYEAGTVINPVAAGILASIGLKKIEVIPFPRISILSTGSEIIEPGHTLKPGQRYDSNRTTLHALLRHDGIPTNEIQSVIPDRPGHLETALRECLKKSDLVITSGGVSMGDFDYIPDVVSQMDGEILFHKVRVKPGKPVLVAKIGGNWVIGLPGNPVSVIAGYHLHVRRLIARLMGQEFQPRSGLARLEQDIHFPSSRFSMLGARLEIRSGEITAEPSQRQQSGRLSSVAEINGFIMIEDGTRKVPAGEMVNVEWLY